MDIGYGLSWIDMAEGITEQGIIDHYGVDALAHFGENPGMTISLGQGLQAEALMCKPVDEDRRRDPNVRAPYLIKALHLGGTAISPEHVHLLDGQSG